ncbi:MAG: hypothetical protein H7255_11275 [Ramlibacter sp.]|nr:hypothetical protein [Ramlibacter sp.]
MNYTPPEQAGADFLDGGEGDDILLGQGGNDDVFGGDGNDSMWGDDRTPADTPATSHGIDDLDGENGNDTMFGAGNDDELFGGADNDEIWGDEKIVGNIGAAFHGDARPPDTVRVRVPLGVRHMARTFKSFIQWKSPSATRRRYRDPRSEFTRIRTSGSVYSTACSAREHRHPRAPKAVSQSTCPNLQSRFISGQTKRGGSVESTRRQKESKSVLRNAA